MGCQFTKHPRVELEVQEAWSLRHQMEGIFGQAGRRVSSPHPHSLLWHILFYSIGFQSSGAALGM